MGLRQVRPGYIKLLTIGVVTVGLLLAWTAVAHAQNFRSGNNTTLPAEETVDGALYMAGRTIDIDGTVNGDIFCAGQNITITGHITGDVICVGQTVHIGGTVDGSVRVAAQSITIGGTVGRNVSAAGQSLTLESGLKVAGDVAVAGQEAVVNATVGRDLAIGSQQATINGKIGRDVRAGSSNLTIGSKAQVSGNVEYTSAKDLQRQDGALIDGSITRHEPTHNDKPAGRSGFAWFIVLVLAALLTLSMVLVLLFPRLFQQASGEALGALGKTFLIGLVATIVAPIIITTLFLSVIGIPLAIVALLLWIVLCILTGPFAAYLLGRVLLRTRTNNAIWYMLLGSVVLLAIYLIPVLNILTMLAVVWFGMGMILLQTRHLPHVHYNQPDDKPNAKQLATSAALSDKPPKRTIKKDE